MNKKNAYSGVAATRLYAAKSTCIALLKPAVLCALTGLFLCFPLGLRAFGADVPGTNAPLPPDRRPVGLTPTPATA